MKKIQLLDKLMSAISDEGSQKLKNGTGLAISAFNRDTILEMLSIQIKNEQEIHAADISDLEKCIDRYLSRHFPEKPEAWKWITISCVYLRFIAERPMHPKEIVKYTEIWENGSVRYKCPARSREADSVCLFCVCI